MGLSGPQEHPVLSLPRQHDNPTQACQTSPEHPPRSSLQPAQTTPRGPGTTSLTPQWQEQTSQNLKTLNREDLFSLPMQTSRAKEV